MTEHKYRFGVTGNYLRTLFPRRVKRTKRNFPKGYYDMQAYVREYFRINPFFMDWN